MSERLSLSVFVPNSSMLPARLEMVKKLFEASPEWFRRPGAIMLLDFLSGEQQTEPWTAWDKLPLVANETLLQTQLLFYYAASSTVSASGCETPPCISVEETHPPHIVYGISLPFSLLRSCSSDHIEQWAKSIYCLFSAWGDCVLAAASEHDLPSGRSAVDVLAVALMPTSSFAWVVAPRHLAQQISFEIPKECVSEFDQAVLFRRYDPLPPLQFV